MHPKMLVDYGCDTGENPFWHPLEKRLYWTDIPAGKLFWYDPATDQHECCYEGRLVGGFTMQPDGALLLFMDRGSVGLYRDGKIQKMIIDHLPDEHRSRFNDVIADPRGRVFCGTMPSPDRPGRLYRLDTDGSIHIILEGIGCSNGMGFTPDRKHMYYTDSPKREIYRFDYDADSGEITNQQVFVRVPDEKGEGVPDGMTVDSHGDVWNARWGGHGVVCYGPDGKEKSRIRLPVAKVSSVAFGGEDYRDMYFTTAGGKDRPAGACDGALYHIKAETPGVAEFVSRIGVK